MINAFRNYLIALFFFFATLNSNPTGQEKNYLGRVSSSIPKTLYHLKSWSIEKIDQASEITKRNIVRARNIWAAFSLKRYFSSLVDSSRQILQNRFPGLFTANFPKSTINNSSLKRAPEGTAYPPIDSIAANLDKRLNVIKDTRSAKVIMPYYKDGKRIQVGQGYRYVPLELKDIPDETFAERLEQNEKEIDSIDLSFFDVIDKVNENLPEIEKLRVELLSLNVEFDKLIQEKIKKDSKDYVDLEDRSKRLTEKIANLIYPEDVDFGQLINSFTKASQFYEKQAQIIKDAMLKASIAILWDCYAFRGPVTIIDKDQIVHEDPSKRIISKSRSFLKDFFVSDPLKCKEYLRLARNTVYNKYSSSDNFQKDIFHRIKQDLYGKQDFWFQVEELFDICIENYNKVHRIGIFLENAKIPLQSKKVIFDMTDKFEIWTEAAPTREEFFSVKELTKRAFDAYGRILELLIGRILKIKEILQDFEK